MEILTRPALTLFGVLWIGLLTSSAQNVSFTASVEQTTVGMGDQFEVTFILNGTGGGKNFRPPAFNEFLVVGGPNQSTNMQFINGAVSSSVSYSYVLQPRAEGKFTIPPATVEEGGKQYQTQPVVVTVVKGSAPQQQRSQPGQQPEESADLGKQIDENLFLKVDLDKSRVYQGEQITATYKLYNRTRLANLSIGKLPAFTGFWSEDLEEIKQVRFDREVVNGKPFNVAVLKKVALFPQRAGTLYLDPMEVTCIVQIQSRRRTNDIFDQFFNDPFFGGGFSNVNHKVKNQSSAITVVPLPLTGILEGFKGAVGKFQMEAWVDKKQTKTNEPVTLKVKISGVGNLKLIESPTIVVPPDLERYDPKISDNFSVQNGRTAGTRTFEYLLIPRHAGDQTIPSFPFAYFNPESKRYVGLHSPSFTIAIGKGTESASSVSTGLSKEDVKLLGEDIRFIKSEGADLQRKGESFAGSTVFYALFVSPFVAFSALVLVIRRRARVFGDIASLKSRKARKMAQRRLVDAKKHLAAKSRERFYEEISRALWGYLGDKMGLPPSDLSIDRVRSVLGARGVSEELLARLTETIEQCEFARFAPPSDEAQLDGMYRKPPN
jgi:hypothetical protein